MPSLPLPSLPQQHSQQIQLQRPGQATDESSDTPDQPPQEAPPQTHRAPRRAMSETQIAKSLSELDVMRMNIVVLNEMMAEIEPGTQTAGEQDLMSQLSTMLKETQKRIVALCERIKDDVLLGKWKEGQLTVSVGCGAPSVLVVGNQKWKCCCIVMDEVKYLLSQQFRG